LTTRFITSTYCLWRSS